MNKRKWLWYGVGLYSLLIALMCFIPQPKDGALDFSTPGIQHFGRIVVLLVPFNSFVNLGQVTRIDQLIWVFLQNAMNVFLIFPLVLQLLYLFPNLRQTKKVVLLSFCISLGIEGTQVLLDILIDANRVFEIDDLWTNTLGGYLAWQCFRWLTHRQEKS